MNNPSQQRQQLKEAIKDIIRNEMFYPKALGFTEMVEFFRIASPKLSKLVSDLLNSENEQDVKNAWKIIKYHLEHKNDPKLASLDEINLKSLGLAGMLGLSALSPVNVQAADKGVKPVVTHSPQKSSILNNSIVDVIKHFENNVNDPRGGYNKSVGKWFPHKSVEGGADTIAYGHKLAPGDDFAKGITDKEALELLKKDIASKEYLAKKNITKYDSYPTYVKNAIVNAFYRGDIGNKTINLINSGQWNKVSAQYLNHANYKSGKYPQVKARMKTNADAFDKYALEFKK